LKKTAAIFFFAVYLLSTTEVYQLLKLPVIFQHYAEHKKEDKSISFFEFLSMHYMHGSPTDKDYNRDMQLPFKTSVDCVSSGAPAFMPSLTEFSIARPFETTHKSESISGDGFLLSSYIASIWQPPKFC
jgi:hypothetical protein